LFTACQSKKIPPSDIRGLLTSVVAVGTVLSVVVGTIRIAIFVKKEGNDQLRANNAALRQAGDAAFDYIEYNPTLTLDILMAVKRTK
jgi:hypothetical protein